MKSCVAVCCGARLRGVLSCENDEGTEVLFEHPTAMIFIGYVELPIVAAIYPEEFIIGLEHKKPTEPIHEEPVRLELNIPSFINITKTTAIARTAHPYVKR